MADVCPACFLLTHIMKKCLYYTDPLKPHFCIVKLGFTGVYIIFLILLKKNIDCGYSLELPQRGSSKEYLQSMFWAGIWKISDFFISNFPFLVVKFAIYLNRRVFIMDFKTSRLLTLLNKKIATLNLHEFNSILISFYILLYPVTWKWQGIMVSHWSSLCVSVCCTSLHPYFCVSKITWVYINGISTKFGMSNDTVTIWIGIANG